MDRITNVLGVQDGPQSLLLLGSSWARSSDIVLDKELEAQFRRQRRFKGEALKKIPREIQRRTHQSTANLAQFSRIPESRSAPETEFGALLAAISDPVITLDRSGEILSLNLPSDAESFLFSRQIVGQHLTEVWTEEIAEEINTCVEKAFRSGRVETIRFPHATGGEKLILEGRIVAGNSGEILMLLRNVTPQDQLEKEILAASESERERIGQELHDSLGQHLSGIKFLCTALTQKAAKQEPIKADDVAYIESQVNVALTQARDLARGLCVVDVEEKGLAHALNGLVRQVEKLKITCEFQCLGDASVLSKRTSKQLYRIAQEAVSNAIKHGETSRVLLRLTVLGKTAALEIENDGKPFRKGTGQNDGIGLRLMNRRARQIGAKLRIEQGKQGGICVACSVNILKR